MEMTLAMMGVKFHFDASEVSLDGSEISLHMKVHPTL